MHFTKLIKVPGYVEPNQTTTTTTTEEETSEIVLLLRKLANDPSRAQPMPCVLAESTLSDDDVSDMLECLMKFHDEYFPNIPLSKDLIPIKQFVYNVPKNVIDGMRVVQRQPNIPDILNPAILMYPLLVEEPTETIGLFMQKLGDLIDRNREAIDEDALAYIADKRYEEESEETGEYLFDEYEGGNENE